MSMLGPTTTPLPMGPCQAGRGMEGRDQEVWDAEIVRRISFKIVPCIQKEMTSFFLTTVPRERLRLCGRSCKSGVEEKSCECANQHSIAPSHTCSNSSQTTWHDNGDDEPELMTMVKLGMEEAENDVEGQTAPCPGGELGTTLWVRHDNEHNVQPRAPVNAQPCLNTTRRGRPVDVEER